MSRLPFRIVIAGILLVLLPFLLGTGYFTLIQGKSVGDPVKLYEILIGLGIIFGGYFALFLIAVSKGGDWIRDWINSVTKKEND